jgi:hypothetical protein
MKKTHALIGLGIATMLLTGAIAYANNSLGLDIGIHSKKSFTELNDNQSLAADKDTKRPPLRLAGNKDKAASAFKDITSIRGVPSEAEAESHQSRYILKNRMTYQEAYDQGYISQFIYDISGDRVVYVVQAQSLKDLEYDGRPIKTPLITTIFDAETGEKITSEWKTVDPKLLGSPSLSYERAGY